jgi:hypothetical protein
MATSQHICVKYCPRRPPPPPPPQTSEELENLFDFRRHKYLHFREGAQRVESGPSCQRDCQSKYGISTTSRHHNYAQTLYSIDFNE